MPEAIERPDASTREDGRRLEARAARVRVGPRGRAVGDADRDHDAGVARPDEEELACDRARSEAEPVPGQGPRWKESPNMRQIAKRRCAPARPAPSRSGILETHSAGLVA